jgi:hypothetical protein
MRAAPDALLAVMSPGCAPGGEDFVALGCRLRAIVRAGDPIVPLGTAGYALLPVGAGTAAATKVAIRLAAALGTLVEVIALDRGETVEAGLLRLGARVAPAAQHPPHSGPER